LVYISSSLLDTHINTLFQCNRSAACGRIIVGIFTGIMHVCRLSIRTVTATASLGTSSVAVHSSSSVREPDDSQEPGQEAAILLNELLSPGPPGLVQACKGIQLLFTLSIESTELHEKNNRLQFLVRIPLLSMLAHHPSFKALTVVSFLL